MSTATATDLIELLRRALASPQDRTLLAEVQSRRDEIRAVIDETECDLPELATTDPAWTSVVMSAVDPEMLSTREPSESDLSHEREAGEYFASILRKAPAQARFHELAHLGTVPASVQADLLATPAAQAAGASAVQPARYGLTPVAFVHAAQAVSNVLHRRYHEGGETFVDVEDISEHDLAHEISLTCECRVDVAETLFRWLLNAADIVRDLFPGFVIVRVGSIMRFVPTIVTSPEKTADERKRDLRVPEPQDVVAPIDEDEDQELFDLDDESR